MPPRASPAMPVRGSQVSHDRDASRPTGGRSDQIIWIWPRFRGATVRPDPGSPAPMPRDQPATLVPDEQLIAATAQRDQQAFAALYDRYAPTVFGLALTMLGNRGDAEEVTQEVFWRVWQQSASYDCSRPGAPWLCSIAHHYCIDELRRRRRRPRLISEEVAAPPLPTIPDDVDIVETVCQAEQRRVVVAALQQLPLEQRQTLELAYFGGLTQSEIAARLGTPLGTIKTRTRLGLKKFRTMLQGTVSG